MEKETPQTPEDTRETLDSIISNEDNIADMHEVVVPAASPMLVSENKSVRIITRITKEQREVLEKYYNQGMKSKSKESRVLQHAAAAECELPVHIILNWIGNRQRQERQVFTKTAAKPRKPKTPRASKMITAAVTSTLTTASDMPSTNTTSSTNTMPTFTTADLVSAMPHQLALLDSITALSGSGSGAGESYLSPAAEELPTVTVVNLNSNEEQIKGLMKQIQELATQLETYGVPTVALHSYDDCVYNSGSKEGQKFLKAHPVVQMALHTYFQEQKEMERLLRRTSLDKMRFMSNSV